MSAADPLRDEVAGLLRRLISCDTSNPPGREAQAAAVLEEHLRPTGLECRRISTDPDRPNLLVRLPGAGTGPSLGFLGHLDVVATRREDWSVEPFAGIERDGAIWGRGAVDMKCQVAATAVALATLAREGFRPAGDLMLLLMADEEVGDAGVGSTYFVEALPELCPDFIVGEGSGERLPTPVGPVYLLDCGVKASASATLTVRGRAGDASLGQAGHDALAELGRLLARLRDHRSPVRIHEAIGPVLDALGGNGTDEQRLARARAADPALDRLLTALTRSIIHATIVEVPGPHNAIPDRAVATLSCILVPGTTEEELEQELRTALGDGPYDLEIVPPKGGLISSADTPLRAAIEAFLAGHDPEARLLPALGYGFSDCDVMREKYGSVAYGFIPFRHGDPMVNLETKHGADERVLVDDLVFQTQAALSVARAIGQLTTRSSASVSSAAPSTITPAAASPSR
ncbi:MAG TPA: M20/M25/M40 family metallo-hydrolase [Baekduia sp.]|nr:M20/M25/M40 family metallo-hydrolase [Baekduia sp.]